jgi:PAS domain S-box-containing protein
MSYPSRFLELLCGLRLFLTLTGLLYLYGAFPFFPVVETITVQKVSLILILLHLIFFLFEKQIILRDWVIPPIIMQVVEGSESSALLGQSGALFSNSLLRKLGEMQTRLRESRLGEQLIADFAVDVILCVDETFVVQEVNQSCLKYWRLTRSEILGRSLLDLVSSKDRKQLQESFDKVRLDNNRQKCCISIQGQGGHVAYADVQLEWSAKHKVFYLEASDVTERKKLEQYKSEYLAMISHDLRAPMGNILMSLDTIIHESSVSDHSVLDVVKDARMNLYRLLSLTEQLVGLENTESTELEIELEICSATELINESIKAIRAVSTSKQIGIETSENDLLVWADEQRIVQVLVNFLSNAVKFSKKGSSIKVVADRMDEHVRFAVSDSGVGIASADLQQLFSRTSSLHRTGTAGERSVGLGLLICKSIIDAHECEIGCTSEENRGSTFWFLLKRAE